MDDRAEVLFRSRLALEQAEAVVGELRGQAPADVTLRQLQQDLRLVCDRVEAVHLDALIQSAARELDRVGA